MASVLIIEDEECVLEMVQQVLQRSGYEVEVAPSGEEGIRKFDQGVYDLVITDIQMPGVDGNWVARHIRRSEKKRTPVIGMSGTPWLFQNSHFDSILSKPFPIRTLVQNVNQFC